MEHNDNKSRKWLYDKFVSQGLNVGKDYAEFDNLMNSNEDSRKWAYEKAVKLGYNVGKDYAEFDSLINPKNDTVTQFHSAFKPEQEGTKDRATLREQVNRKQFNISPFSTRKTTQQAEQEAMFPGSSTLNERIESVINSGKLDAYLNETEEKEIDSQFKPKEVKSPNDVYTNYANRFALTTRGKELNEELADIQKEVSDKYATEFLQSDRYKELAQRYSGEELNRKATETFEQQYSEQIEQAMRPYMNEYNQELGNRYAADIQRDVKDLTKKGILSDVQQLSASVEEQQKAMHKRLKMYSGQSGNAMNALMGSRQYNQESASAHKEQGNLEAAQSLLEESQNIIDEAGKTGNTSFMGGLGRGIADSFTAETWTMGLADMRNAKNLQDVLNKFDKGESLNASEQALMDAAVANMATNAYYHSDLGRGYKAGLTTGESIPFMLEFAINPVSASGSGIAKSILRYGMKKFGKDMAKKEISKFGARLAGDALAAAGMTATSGLGRVAAGSLERQTGTIQLNDNGRGYDGRQGQQSASEATFKSAASTFLENQSEMVFNAFRGIGPSVWATAEKVLPGGITSILEKATQSKAGELYKQIKSSPVLVEAAKRTQFHGIGEEYLEEVYNNFANIPLGEMTIEEATNLDRNIDTFLGLAPTSAAFGLLGVGGLAYEQIQHRRKLNSALGQMNRIEREKLSKLNNMSYRKGNEDLKQFIKQTLSNKSLTREDKKANLNVAYNMAVERSLDDIGKEQLQELRTNSMQAIEEGKFIYATHDPKSIRQTVLRKDVAQERLQATGMEADVIRNLEQGSAVERQEILSGFDNQVREAATDYLNKFDRLTAMEEALDAAHDEERMHAEKVTEEIVRPDNTVMVIPLGKYGNKDVQYGIMINGIDADGQSTQENGTLMVYPMSSDSNGQPIFSSIDTNAPMTIVPGNMDLFQTFSKEEVFNSMLPGYAEDLSLLEGSPIVPQASFPILLDDGSMQNVTVLGNDGAGNWTLQLLSDGKVLQPMPEKELSERKHNAELAPILQKYQTEAQIQKEAQTEAMAMEYNAEVMALEPELGDKIVVDGRNAVITQVLPDGLTVAFTNEEGDLIGATQVSKEAFYAYKQSLADAEETKQNLRNVPNNTRNLENNTENVLDSTENVPESNNTNIPAIQHIPKDEKGNTLYELVEPEDAWDAIVEQSGDDVETAGEVVADIVAEKKEALKQKEAVLKKLKESKKPQKTDATLLSIEERIAAKKYAKEQIKQAQADADVAKEQLTIWENIASIPLRRMQETERKEKEAHRVMNTTTQDTLPNADQHPNEHKPHSANKSKKEKLNEENTEPLNGEEFAAQMLSSGSLPLLRDSYLRETGFGTEEAQRMIGLFRTKEKGGMTVEKAGEKLMVSDRENGTHFFDEQDANAGRDAILSVLSEARTRGDLTNYIRKKRETEKERMLEAERDAYEQKIEENFHMTIEEYELYMKRLEQENPFKDVNVEEIAAIFAEAAEEYNNYLKQQEYEQSRTNENSERSDNLLLGTQSNYSGRLTESQTDRNRAETSRENARHDATAQEIQREQQESLGDAQVGERVEDGNETTERGGSIENNSRQGEITPSLFQYFTGTLSELIAQAKQSAQGLIKKVIAPISSRLKNDLNSQGLQIDDDYNHVIDNNAIRHTLKKHSGKNEEKRGQIPITDADFENIADVVEHYDGVEVVPGNTSAQRIIYHKAYQDGTVIFVEEQRVGRKELAAVTMWKKKNPNLTDANRTETTLISDLTEVSDDKDTTNSPKANELGEKIAKAEAEVNVNPTDKQKEAGNYKKGHIQVGVFDITIEQPKGSVRSGVDANGNKWETTMQNTYGYIRGTEGVDGDHIDVFLSDDIDEWNGRRVFVVDQYNEDGNFDEHKVMLGFNETDDAEAAYFANYDKDWAKKHKTVVTGVNLEDFEKWIDSSHRKMKAFAEYKSVKDVRTDHQGNPVNADDSLLVEKIESINELTDEDFLNSFRNVELPILPKKVDEVIGANGKPVVIKKNIFEQNRKSHKDVSPAQSREILFEALYEPTMYGQNQKTKRPYNWILIHNAVKHSSVVLEVNHNKDNIEIVNWHYLEDDTLEQKKRQAINEGGLILTLESVAGNTINGLSSESKDIPFSQTLQGNEVENPIVESGTIFKNNEAGGNAVALVVGSETKNGKRRYLISFAPDLESAENRLFFGDKYYSEAELQAWIDSKRFIGIQEWFNNSQTSEKNDLREQKANGEREAVSTADAAYTITPAKYTTKRGKVLDMHLVKFNIELRDAVRKHTTMFAKQLKGWWDKEKQGFMMRSKEDAERLAEYATDAQSQPPVSMSDMQAVNDGNVQFAEPQLWETSKPEEKQEYTPVWQYSVSVDKETGLTTLKRDDVSGPIPIGDGRFNYTANSPEEMLEIVRNPKNFNQELRDAVETILENKVKIREIVREEKAAAAKQEPKPGNNPSGNRLVTDERYEELKKKMKLKIRGRMNMGIDPEILAIGTEMAVYHIEKGSRKFAEYATAMIADLGDAIRPYLKAFYNGARDLPEVAENGLNSDMTSYDEVQKFDVANFDKPNIDILATAETVTREARVSDEAEIAKERIKKKRSTSKKEEKKAVNSQQSNNPNLFDNQFNDQSIGNNERIRKESAKSTGTQRERNSENGTGGKDRQSLLPSQGGNSGSTIHVEQGRVDSDIQGRRNDGRRDSRLPETRSQSEAERSKRGLQDDAIAKKNTHNNHSERGKDHAPTSVDARIEANIKAIELAKQLLESGEKATEKQMQVLRKFSGWGGLGKAFSEGTSYAPNPTQKKLRELLGEKAYQEAVMSANSAYYTPAYVIDTLWDIAEQMGFKGGNILEGSAGIGNILGQMPTSISERSDIHAIEIDGTSGGILSLLYPDAKVDIQGFEQTRIPNGSVDLAITNVPFVTGLRVNDTTGDKDLSKKFHNIHDFCIAKNVRKLREGGLGIFITSNGTLDNSKKLRDWIVNEGGADFVGAFRMHNKTFGGTGVTSDIVVIRKRVNGQKSVHAIDVSDVSGERMAEYDTGETRKIKGKETPVIKQLSMDYNRYFIEHPENMAGEMHFAFEKGDTFRPTSKGLYPAQDKKQEQMLSEFVHSFKAEEFGERNAGPVTDVMPDKKIGEIFVRDGKLFINSTASAQPLEVNANKVKGHTKVECFEAYTAIKEALAEVLSYQTENESDEGLKPLLDKLNKAYDDFVGTYGHFNKNTAIAFLRNDVDYANVFALEKFEETADEKGNRIQKFDKTDVFRKRVVEKEKEPTPANVKDGIIASIFKFGRVDIPYIAEQLGTGIGDVKKEIIEKGYGFENPVSRQIEASYQYLSGNIREKLRQAEANNENGEFDRNIKALQEVMPMEIPAHLIDFTLGSSWIDPKLYDDFVKERTEVDVQFTAVGGTWFMKEPYFTNYEKNRAMGVTSEVLGRTIMGHTLIEAAIQNRSITVSTTKKHYDGTTETITDKEATQACAAKIDEIRQDFKDWARQKMQSDPEISERMERIYNDMFNNFVPMGIPEEFVPEYFGGASHKFKMRPHQGKAIVRGTQQPLLLAHEVGTGKTFTLISTAMEMRRLGTARKPMIVVQNATVGQFVASAKELYPNAKILTLEESDRSAEGRKNFYAKIRYNDWDMIVVPQSTFEFIPDSEEREMAFVQDKIEEKMLILEKMKEEDPDGKNMITRQAEREIELLEEQLAGLADNASKKRTANDEKKRAVALQNAEVKAMEMLDRKTDDVENFDDMGIDALLVDEAHEYKHLGFATAMQRGVKGVDPSYSKKSQGVFLKTQAVLEKNNGRNVIFATGTPISNTAAEIWTFMRYLMPADTMKEYGIYYFDDFVRNFGNIQQMLEFTTSGKFKENNRFAGYVNLPELVRIWSGVSDTVLTKEAGGVKDKIPEIEGEKAQDLYLPQTRALRSIMKFVKSELEHYEQMSGKEKKENSHIPLTMYGIAKAAAVDARLVQTDAEDDPNSKTNEAVRQTLRSLKETADYKGTVAIFADNYQNKQSGFNLYDDIRNKLIAEGVPADEIVVMRSGMTVKKKLEIFEKVNRGEIRVILGSTFTLGTGVNIQERLHTLIHLDAPNRPMDYTQRNGRILRQGNLHKDMNKPVRILRFGVEDSLDVTAYQRLKTKGAIADSIMNGKQMMNNSMTNRVLEEEEDVFGDTVAQLSGSEYAMLKNNAEKNVRKYASRKKQWETDQTYIHNVKPRLKAFIKDAEKRIEDNGRYLEAVRSSFPDGQFKEIVIGKHRFTSVDTMDDFFKEHNKSVLAEMKQMKDGEISGEQKRELTIQIGDFSFVVTTRLTRKTMSDGATLFNDVERKMTYSCPELGIEDVPVRQNLLRNAIEDITGNVITGKDFAERLNAGERSKKHNEAELKELLSREGKPFEYEEELTQAKSQLEEYAELMKKELEEKEAKYAEMDASVETANDITNTDEDDVLYRSDDELEEVNERFNDELRQQINGTLPKGHVYQLGNPGKALLSSGIPDLPIELAASRLSDKSMQENHPFDLPEVEDLPKAIQNPLAVFRSATHIGSFVVMTEIEHKGKNFVVAIQANKKKGRIEINDIRSVHYRTSNAHMANWILEGLLEYTDKKRMAEWLSKQRYNSAEVRKLFNRATKIVENFENPKIADENLRNGIGAYTDDEVSYENDPAAKLLGRSGRTAKQRREFAQRERQRMVEKVESLVEKLHLDNVEIVTDASTLEGKKQRAKGFYSKSTGKITIVVPNHSSVFDIEQTLLHEAVAHYGLRQLFGEHFDTFLDNVFNNADENIRRRIVDMAAKNGWDFHKATEEYLASLAEDTEFENINASWWRQIKDFFLNMLHKIGFEDFRGVTLSDNELRYILWRSYENLAEPGRYRSILGEAADIAKQYKLKVGNYTGTPSPTETKVAEAGELEEINEKFNEELEKLTENNADKTVLSLGTPSEVLIAAGISDKQMKLYGNKIIKKMKKHGFKLEELRGLPLAVANPIAVFNNYQTDGNRSILTELRTFNGNFLVTVDLGKDADVDFNIVTSVFGKRNNNVIDWINKGYATYINKEKALSFLSHQSALIAATAANSGLESQEYMHNSALSHATNIVENFENPNIREHISEEEDIYFRHVRLSERPEIIKEYDAIMASSSYQFQEAFQDSMLSLKVVQELIEKQSGRKARSFENAYMAENQMSSKNKVDMDSYFNSYYNPLCEHIKRLTDKYGRKNVEDYIYAKSGLERNEVFLQREAKQKYDEGKSELDKKLENGEITDLQYQTLMEILQKDYDEALHKGNDYSGLEDLAFSFHEKELDNKLENEEINETEYKKLEAEIKSHYKEFAEKLVADMEQTASDEEISELWNFINQATNEILDIQLRGGLLSKEKHDDIKSMMKYYVPMRGWNENVAEDVYEYTRPRPIVEKDKKAKGRKSLADNPIVTIGLMGQNAIVRANRNKMKQHFFNFIINRPNELATIRDVWYEHNEHTVFNQVEAVYPEIEENDDAEAIQRKLDELDKRMEAKAAQGLAYRGKIPFGMKLKQREGQKREHMVSVCVNGKEYIIYINGDPRAAQALNGLTNPEAENNKIISIYNRLKRYYGSSLTSANPDFVLSNLVRDSIHASTMVFLDKGFLASAHYVKNVPQCAAAVVRGLTGKGNDANELDRYFKEFIENGGETGYTALHTLEDYRKEYERNFREIKGLKATGKELTQEAIEKMVHWFEFANRIAEDINRFNAYVSARKTGNGITESVDAAKNITVNFNKKGSLGKGRGIWGAAAQWISGWILFFNPSVQGMFQIYQVAKKNRKRFYRTMGTIMLSGFVMPYLNSLLCGGDDDKYFEQTDYTRMNNWLLYTDNGFVKIPLPPVFRELYGMGDIFYRLLTGRATPERASIDTIRQIQSMAGFLKLIPNEGEPSVKSIATGLTPDLLAPIIDVLSNEDFLGQKIYKDEYYTEFLPEYERVYKGVSPIFVEASRYANKLGGDDARRSPYWMSNWNPAVWEHLITGYTGGLGKTISNIVSIAIDTVEGNNENVLFRSVPIANRFFSTSNEETAAAAINRTYYDYRKRYEEAKVADKRYRQFVKEGRDFGKELEYMEKNGELEFVRYFHTMDKKVRKYQDALRDDPNNKELEQELRELKARIVLETRKMLEKAD